MRYLIKTKYSILSLLFLIPLVSFAQTPPGVDITLDYFLDLAKRLAGFLIVAGGALAGITIVGTGIMYLTSGGNAQKMAGAKNMFKAGMIGALIIFSPGVIINLVSGSVTNPLLFFEGSGGGSPTATGTSTPVPTSSVDVVYGCSSSGACVLSAGGIYADSTCAGQCGGTSGSSTAGACFDCTNNGDVWCLATATCLGSESGCPGVFTKVPGGCP